jgi:hypothetical protein
MPISTAMKLIFFVSTVRTLATVMMYADITRVAVGQLFKDIPAVLIVYYSAGFPKNHLLQFLDYLSHFSGDQVVKPALTYEWWSGEGKSLLFLFCYVPTVFL